MTKPQTTPFTIPKLPSITHFDLAWDYTDKWWECQITPECAGPIAEGIGRSPRAAVNSALKDLKQKELEGCYV